MPLQLRDYQLLAIDDVRAQYAAGKRAPVLVIPTGGGKTVVASYVIKAAVDRGRRVLFCAGRRELLGQTVKTLAAADVTDVRLIQAQRDEGDPDAPVVVASVDTLRTERWMDKLPPADLLVLDECHHGAATTWSRLLNAYPNVYRLGLSATPERGDGRPLGDMFDCIVTGPSVRVLTDQGHLVPCIVFPPAGGEKLEAKELALDPVGAYQRHGSGERGIAFCTSREHAKRTADEFRSAGIASDVVDGTMAAAARKDVLARSRDGAVTMLCSVGVLTEGYDDPAAVVAILARGFGHPGLFIQCAGRVLRPAPGKKRAILIDLVGSVYEHGTPDAERVYSLDGKAMAAKREAIKQCRKCGAVYRPSERCPNCGAEAPREPFSAPTTTGEGLTQLTGTLEPRQKREHVVVMVSKRFSYCASCKEPISPGDEILWATQAKLAAHRRCEILT